MPRILGSSELGYLCMCAAYASRTSPTSVSISPFGIVLRKNRLCFEIQKSILLLPAPSPSFFTLESSFLYSSSSMPHACLSFRNTPGAYVAPPVTWTTSDDLPIAASYSAVSLLRFPFVVEMMLNMCLFIYTVLYLSSWTETHYSDHKRDLRERIG